MTRYAYRGAVQALTLTDAAGRVVFDGVLVPGRSVRLPDHRRVERMREARILVPLPDTAEQAPPPVPPKRGRRRTTIPEE